MGIYLQIVDHDELFESAKTEPVLVNNFNLTSQNEVDQINDLIYTTYDDDTLEVLPTCDCGKIKGGDKVGRLCPKCGTVCLSVTERPLESLLWIATPKGVDTLINPEVFIIFKKKFLVSGVSVFEWMINPNYRIPKDIDPPPIVKLKECGYKRGLNNFFRNFDSIMNTLIHDKIIKLNTVSERHELLQFIKENRKALFSKHIPLPSKLTFITEKTAMGTYADPTITSAVDAIRTISSIENSVTPLNQNTIESRTVQALTKISEYYETFFKASLSPKAGWFRKHIFGSRVHFSFRAVITSLSQPHSYDEVHLPWSLSVMFLKVHLINKLLKRNFTPNEAIRHLYEHTLKYDILLDEIFNELIAESFEGGIPIILQRNPSLTRGSIQQLRVTKVKSDPEINTVSVSVLILPAWNADFDGDALNAMLIHDFKSLNSLSRLKPHLYALDIKTPRKLSGYMALPVPVVSNIAAWVHEEGY